MGLERALALCAALLGLPRQATWQRVKAAASHFQKGFAHVRPAMALPVAADGQL